MKNILKLITLLALVAFISGCAGPSASFTEKLQDTFLLTSADGVSANEHKCITLTKPYSFKSGLINYSLPAGRYVAKRKHKSGYFYYASAPIKTQNSFFYPYQSGIYLENTSNKGYLFGSNPTGFDDRPIRGSKIPNEMFAYIKRNSSC